MDQVEKNKETTTEEITEKDITLSNKEQEINELDIEEIRKFNELHELNDIEIETLQKIPFYLNTTKSIIIKMNQFVDSYEISKSLTASLNRILIGRYTQLNEVYDSIMENYDSISEKIIIIEDKINEFNNSEENKKYFIDPENIRYLVFFKQIVYIKNLILEIDKFIELDINLVFTYSYIISKLYNEPSKVSSNYIYILQKMTDVDEKKKEDHKLSENYDKLVKYFISKDVIDKIYVMIKKIYESDSGFQELLKEYSEKKMQEYKKNNVVEMSESLKQIEKEIEEDIKNKEKNKSKKESDKKESDKKESDNNLTIFANMNELEKSYKKKIDNLFFKIKRNIVIENLCNSEYVNSIFDENRKELWFGYNLFIYKRFNFDFLNYSKIINSIIGSNVDDILKLNYLEDLNAPDAGILKKNNTDGSEIIVSKGNDALFGGSQKYLNDKYYLKYIKYKNKYLNLKNI